MDRFRIEQRSGIIAIYDAPGCHGDEPYTVCHWTGYYNGEAGHWLVPDKMIQKAKDTLKLLNDLHDSAQQREDTP